MVFDQVLEELDQKGSVEIAKYDILKKNSWSFFSWIRIFTAWIRIFDRSG